MKTNITKINPKNIIQPELIEAIADVMCEKLKPIFDQIDSKLDQIQDEVLRLDEKNDSGVLIGSYQITRYMSLKHTLSKRGSNGALGVHSQTLKRWYNTKGFPMNKNPRGRWWTTKSLVDEWMRGREMMMRKGKELGFKAVSRIGKGGYVDDVQPEKYTPEQRTKITIEIKKDRIRKAVGNG